MIEQIETKQIVLYLPGDIRCTYKPPVMYHMSCARCHTSPFNLFQIVRARDLQFSPTIHYNLCVHCHISGGTYQVSHIRCYISGVTCHLSRVMCHVLWFICHVLCVICNIYFFLQSGLVGWLRLSYQQGLHRLVLRFFPY